MKIWVIFWRAWWKNSKNSKKQKRRWLNIVWEKYSNSLLTKWEKTGLTIETSIVAWNCTFPKVRVAILFPSLLSKNHKIQKKFSWQNDERQFPKKSLCLLKFCWRLSRVFERISKSDDGGQWKEGSLLGRHPLKISQSQRLQGNSTLMKKIDGIKRLPWTG